MDREETLLVMILQQNGEEHYSFEWFYTILLLELFRKEVGRMMKHPICKHLSRYSKEIRKEIRITPSTASSFLYHLPHPNTGTQEMIRIMPFLIGIS